MKPKIAVLVLNWCQPKLTIQTIDSLLKIKHPDFDYHLFLLDNHSTDNSFSLFQQKYSHHSQVSLFSSAVNLMFTAGNNFLLKKIKGSLYQYTLLLNNDVILDPNFLQILFKFIKQNPKYTAVSPKIYFAPGYEYQKKYKASQSGRVIWALGGKIDWANIYASNAHIDEVDNGQFNKNLIDPDYLSGCCLLTKTSFIKNHPLDQNYWMYLEDVDFCQKIKLAGSHLAVIPAAKIWHLNSASTSPGGYPLHDYYLSRNRLIFGFRYASFKTKLALIRQSIRQLLSSTPKWQKIGIIDFYLHRWGRGSFHGQ